MTPPGAGLGAGPGMTRLEVGLVAVILLLWLMVIRLFLQRWDKLSKILPYQPVYSKEMSEKIEEEADKLRSANSFEFSTNKVTRTS